jgi:hypothetical protein
MGPAPKLETKNSSAKLGLTNGRKRRIPPRTDQQSPWPQRFWIPAPYYLRERTESLGHDYFKSRKRACPAFEFNSLASNVPS